MAVLLLFAVISAAGIGFAALIIIGVSKLIHKKFRSGFAMLTPPVVIMGAILIWIYKSNGNSWDYKTLMMFLFFGFFIMMFVIGGGIVLIQKKEPGSVIIGILLLLAAAALFKSVYLPIFIKM